MSEPATPIHKVFCVNNIKSHIPLTLDLERLNYDAWRELFTTYCEAYDALDHIDDTYDDPTPKPTDPNWKKVDSTVKGWIYSTLSQNTLNMILKRATYARQVWLTIERLFRDNKDSRAIQLDTELRNLSMGDLSVTAYFTKIKSIADLLENLDPQAKVPDKNLVIYAINGLSSRFDNVVGIIRHPIPFPSFEDTRSILLSEEQRILLHRPLQSSAHSEHSSSPSLLHTTTDSSRRQVRR
ncbi:uncharacterized protein LOC111876960 [Lactuca sativa]|uniref:uncharacterized protein LOC111876960 n=1 Tax=Lactuca sativa TaxID=4236 RepID=UPI000CD7E2BA|nr:uncharacterized protein LOC111876960 [Lactuca sativa]